MIHSFTKVGTREPDPRVNSVDRNAELRRNFRRIKSFHVVHDDDRLAIEVQATERAEDKIARFKCGTMFGRKRRLVMGIVVPIATKPAIVGRITYREREEPRSYRTSAIVVTHTTVNSDKEFLRNVLEIGLTYPKASERTAHVVELRVEEFAEVGGKSPCSSFARLHLIWTCFHPRQTVTAP